jgi:UDP-galactopyranose mutase
MEKSVPGMSQPKILIVGAGFYGAVCARLLRNTGCNVHVIDKKEHVGGTCYTFDYNGIAIHKYGIHVFHTSDKEVWDFVNRYGDFRQYELKVVGTDGKQMYTMPFNMFLMQQIYGTNSPEEAYKAIECDKPDTVEDTFENKVQRMVGKTMYERVVKTYTEKQWGTSVLELSPDIIGRLPIRFSYDNRYFNDRYQGLPECGYTKLIENILTGIDGEEKVPCSLGEDFLQERDRYLKEYDTVIYCGSVDELLDYRLGVLDWRSLRFEERKYLYNGHNGQGCPLLNNFRKEDAYTRTIDHIHLGAEQPHTETIMTYEYPQKWEVGKERYYPISNEENRRLYDEYCSLLHSEYPNIELGGRIGLYRYMDMDDTVRAAMDFCKKIKNEKLCI